MLRGPAPDPRRRGPVTVRRAGRGHRCRTRSRSRSCPAGRPSRSARIASSPWRPISTTSSPTAHRASSPTSTMQLIHRDHADDRAPPAADRARRRRAGRAACRAAAAPRRRSRSAPSRPSCRARTGAATRTTRGDPAATRLTWDTRAFSDITGRRSRGEIVDARPGRDAVERDPGPHERAPARGERERAGRVGGVHHRRRRPGRRELGEHRVEAGELLLRSPGDPGSSAHARWVNTASIESVGASVATCSDEIERVGAATRRRAACPVSTLRCTSSLRSGCGGRGGERVDVRAVCRPSASSRGRRGRGVVGRLLAEHEDRGVDARLAQRDALCRQRHAQPLGTGRERLLGDRDRRRGRSRRP